MNEMIERLLTIAAQNPDGFTIDLQNFSHINSGWVVAMKETQNSFGIEGLKKVLTVALKTTKIVGGWKDGNFYWDAVYIFHDENEATKAGIDNEQIAIYNINTATVKFLK